MGTADRRVAWQEHHQARTVALNVGWRYVTVVVELLLGVVMLPVNTRYLGASDYGLWMLAASIVAYFPVLDLGYGAAMERFVAHFRARRDARAINEVASTLVFVFAGIGIAGFAVVAAVAWNLGDFFNLDARQARTGALVLVCVGAQFAFGLPFAIFGAVVNGFQRTSLNAAVGAAVSVAVAAVNIAVLLAGGGLVALVATMAATRMFGYIAYRLNAYRVFPLLRIRPALFRVARLREVSRFSGYMLINDLSGRLNYTTDPMVIAAVLTTGAVGIWTVAQRLADIVLRLTNQLNEVLFPVVVDCDSAGRNDRLRDVLVQGTRLSLAVAIPVVGSMALMAGTVVTAWAGPDFAAATPVLQLLSVVVLVRVGSATAGIVLRGAGHLRLLAISGLAAAVVNIALSILLIRTHGLAGVAFATLLPITVRAIGIVMPVACVRVGMPVGRFVAVAVWPTAWPAAVALGCLWLLRDGAATSLGTVMIHGATVALLYAVLFVGVAVGRADRARYLGKLRSIARWPALETA